MTVRPDFEARNSSGSQTTEQPCIRLADEASMTIGPLLIEPARRRMSRGERELTLEPRAMQVLVALLRSPGEVVSHDDLFASCWNGVIVDDNTISRAISRLRGALSDVANGVLHIETIARVGHRIVLDPALAIEPKLVRHEATVRTIWPKAALVVVAIAALIGAIWVATTWRDAAASPAKNAVAILPIAAAAEDRFLAEGLTEQIRIDLRNRSDLQVIGSTSSDLLGAASDDAGRAGRLLGVRYLLQGNMVRSASRVRVSLSLIDVASRRHLWADTIEGSLGDTVALEDRISARVMSSFAVRVGDKRPVSQSGSFGEAYGLYLTARGLIHTRQPARLAIAADLLQRAVELAPDYAPAWASLGTVEWLNANSPDPADRAVRKRAVAQIKRALELDPKLAEAHGSLALMSGFETPAAAAHLDRAVTLDPDSSELQFWRGHALVQQGDFLGSLASYRRARKLDPLWLRAATYEVEMLTFLEYDDRARSAASEFVRVTEPWPGEMMRGYLAFGQGKLADAARHFRRAREIGDGDGRSVADYDLSGIYSELGMREHVRPEVRRILQPLWQGRIPHLEEVRARNTGSGSQDIDFEFMTLATKRYLQADRGGSLAPLYDSPAGLLDISKVRSVSPTVLVQNAALVALVLRQAGRPGEADRLLMRADIEARRISSRGRVPGWFLVAAAHDRAVMGRRSEALKALEVAVGRGWSYGGNAAMQDLADEPAFASLRKSAQFERICQKLRVRRANEIRQLVKDTNHPAH
jgi:TolB-like protein/DNA-binding winged helix-turn-helix (wHTH) protein